MTTRLRRALRLALAAVQRLCSPPADPGLVHLAIVFLVDEARWLRMHRLHDAAGDLDSPKLDEASAIADRSRLALADAMRSGTTWWVPAGNRLVVLDPERRDSTPFHVPLRSGPLRPGEVPKA